MLTAALLASRPVDGAVARRAARAVLRGREYRRDEPSLLSRAVHWATHQIGRLLTGGGGSYALLLVLVVIVVVLVVLAVRAGPPTRRRVDAGGTDVDPLAPVTSRDHRRIAAELTAEGRHREALREWLRAAVQTIEERGVLPPRPGRTGAVTAREAGPLLPRAAAELNAATTAFDEVWFGRRAATAADVEHARCAAEAVLTARIGRVGAGTVEGGIAVPW